MTKQRATTVKVETKKKNKRKQRNPRHRKYSQFKRKVDVDSKLGHAFVCLLVG